MYLLIAIYVIIILYKCYKYGSRVVYIYLYIYGFFGQTAISEQIGDLTRELNRPPSFGATCILKL